MRTKKVQKVYNVTLVFTNQVTRTVSKKASSLEVAERRALKHNPTAIGVKRNA